MFAIYLAAMLGIGALGYLGAKNLSDYILGGRSLGSVVTALSAGASDMSGWLLMGLPGAVYLSGLSESWIAIGLIAGAWLNWRLVAGRLRLYTERAGNALTLPDYFAYRFEDENNILRIVTAMVILVFFTVYCASGVVAGALLAAIFAAVMSTLSCQLLVCSSALTEDIYRTFLRKQASQKELVWFGRAMVLAIALIAISIARNPQARVLGMVSYAWAGFGAAFGPVIILSLFNRRITRDGALAGIVTGAVTVLVWKQFGWFGLYEIVPGFILGWAATLGVSRLGQPSAAMLEMHAGIEREMAQSGSC